jgi:hypothetical protein
MPALTAFRQGLKGAGFIEVRAFSLTTQLRPV